MGRCGEDKYDITHVILASTDAGEVVGTSQAVLKADALTGGEDNEALFLVSSKDSVGAVLDLDTGESGAFTSR